MRGDPEHRQPDRLDRLWEATRPPAPSAEAWDRVWEAVVRDETDATIEPPALPMPTTSPARFRRWAAVGLVLAAQAAAVLLAVGIGLRPDGPAPDAPRVSHTETAVVHIEEGQLVLIRSEADAVQATDLTPQAGPAGVDAWYLVYNRLESMAGPVVAMSE